MDGWMCVTYVVIYTGWLSLKGLFISALVLAGGIETLSIIYFSVAQHDKIVFCSFPLKKYSSC